LSHSERRPINGHRAEARLPWLCATR
jgi:hypothetical protein